MAEAQTAPLKSASDLSINIAVETTENGPERGGSALTNFDEDIKTMLNVFAFEFLDPDQELFFQHPSTFPRFPQLPLEIRLMVWRNCFNRALHIWDWRACRTPGHNFGRPFPTPITSRISQESRCETLKRYLILTSERAGWQRCVNNNNWHKGRTFFWHGGLDVLQMPSFSVYHFGLKGYFMCHFGYDEQLFRIFCDSIRTLHITRQHWGPRDSLMTERVLDTFPALQTVQLEEICQGPTQGRLQCFHQVVGKNPQDCLDAYKQFFENLVKENPARTLPNIVITRDGKTVFGPGFS